MIIISECKMPLPYGKCKCFQSGTCSIRNLTDALIRLLCFPNMSAKRKLNKEWRASARLQQRKARNVPADKLPVILRSTKQFMMDASVWVMSYSNFCAPERTLCPWEAKRKLDSRWRTVNTQGSATLSLLRRYSNKTQERAMHVLSFSFSSGFQDYSKRLQGFNMMYSKKINDVMFF